MLNNMPYIFDVHNYCDYLGEERHLPFSRELDDSNVDHRLEITPYIIIRKLQPHSLFRSVITPLRVRFALTYVMEEGHTFQLVEVPPNDGPPDDGLKKTQFMFAHACNA